MHRQELCKCREVTQQKRNYFPLLILLYSSVVKAQKFKHKVVIEAGFPCIPTI